MYRFTREDGPQTGNPNLATIPQPTATTMLGMPLGTDVVLAFWSPPKGMGIMTAVVDEGFLSSLKQYQAEQGEDIGALFAVVLLPGSLVPDTIPEELNPEGEPS